MRKLEIELPSSRIAYVDVLLDVIVHGYFDRDTDRLLSELKDALEAAKL